MERRTAQIFVYLPCLALACIDGVIETAAPGGATPGDSSPGNGSGPPASGMGSQSGNAGPGTSPPGTGAGPAVGEKPPTTLPGTSACTTDVPGPRLLRRLTSVELGNTLEDLFNDPEVPRTTALPDPEVLGFKVDAAQLLVRDLGAQQLADFADEVSQWAVSKLPTLSTCTTNDPTCRQTFIKTFGRRAFRAPLSDAQVRSYDALFAAEATFNDGAQAVIGTMLQSPNLLYRRELGKPDAAKPGTYLLTPHEVASNLSYLLTQGPPDQQLAQAADSGALASPGALDAQADRLMWTPRGRKTLGAFVRGWLGLDRLETVTKDDQIFPLSPELRRDMQGESEALFLEVFDRSGTLSDLFTASYSFVNLGLSQFYGVNSGAGGTGFIRVMRPASQRDPGILGHASVLATHATGVESSPVKRGKLVRTRILCQGLPDPPQDVDTMLKPAMPNQSTRQRHRQHSEDPTCASCHKLMDPIGFGFERYDGFGRRRDNENGVTVDASGTLTGTAAGDVAFNGVGELEATLAKSDEARACLVRTWSYFAFGVASWPQDGCTQKKLVEESAKGQFSLRSVLMAIIHSPHFIRRVAP
jgi:hypothetical protein